MTVKSVNQCNATIGINCINEKILHRFLIINIHTHNIGGNSSEVLREVDVSVANESECLEMAQKIIEKVFNDNKTLTDQQKEKIIQRVTIDMNQICLCGSSNRGACMVGLI